VITYVLPPPRDAEPEPEAIPFHVLYEDEDLIAVDKPPGMVVHPAPGNERGTLVNALLHHCDDLQGIGGERRPGIVHRIDKETSGVLVVAKNDATMHALQEQFQSRSVRKEYVALVWGCPEPEQGTIEAAIHRDPHHRTRMAVAATGGRRAVSHYQLMERFAETSLVRVWIETGRTHQIRVHMAHLGYPVVGDKVYGGVRRRHPLQAPRQMLHAEVLQIRHPRGGELLLLEAPWPQDLRDLLAEISSPGDKAQE
jgi:23S rRNA pseudouridine1911/1915/1917 synthase